jgi:type VI secretion system secreted protein Hcp
MAIPESVPSRINKSKMDGFLEIPDIKGPSKRDGHDDHIEVFDINFEMIAPFDSNSLSRKGRVSLGTVDCRKHVDMSSPYIAKACHENKLLDEVKIYCRRTIDGKTSDYFVVTLKEASVVSYRFHVADGEDDTIEDSMSFAYKNIELKYDEDHTVDMDVSTGM